MARNAEPEVLNRWPRRAVEEDRRSRRAGWRAPILATGDPRAATERQRHSTHPPQNNDGGDFSNQLHG